MVDRKFLFVNKEMIDRINQGRGELSQNEFIRRCVDRFLTDKEPPVTVRRRVPVKVWRDDEEVRSRPRKRAGDKNSFMFMDEDLLDRIDAHRGGISRADFIEQSITSRVPRVVVRESVDYATREEFQEFRGFVKNTLKDLADILFHSNGSGKAERYLDAPYRPRRRYDEVADYEYERPAPRPRPRSREYYDEDYRPRRPVRRYAERRYEEDRDREREGTSYRRRERVERYPSEERRETGEAPPPAREPERYPREADYPPPAPPPPQNVRPAGAQQGTTVRGMLDGLKNKLQGWLFTQEEPQPAAGGYPPAATQSRYNDYNTSNHDVSRHEVSRYDVTRHETVIRDAAPVAEVVEEEPESQNMHPGLWGLAILLFGFGDTLLSTMVFAKGGYEANPLMGGLVSFFGGSIVAFVIIKTVIMGVLALISFKVFKKQGWLIPGILILVGAFLVLSNLMAYMKL